MKKIILGLVLIASVTVFFSNNHPTQAAISEPGFEEETVASGLTLPTGLAFAPDGRIFVALKGGTVRVVKNGTLLSTPVITLTDVNTFGDRGLIGIATDPNFLSNGYLYLSYTHENTPGSDFGGPKTGRIARVTVVGDVASESSKVVLLGSVGGNAGAPSCENFAVTADCIPSDSSSHSVGGLSFGPDGYLYATTGEGADFSTVDPRALRAQNLDSLGGKVLRIKTDGTAPTTNPFYNGDANANRSKVYALGARNMYRIHFRPSNGALYGGDVGWSSWEEINRITAGKNYGWPCREGNTATSYNCTAAGAVNPVYTYGHNSAGAGSITAGAFPSNGAYPAAYDNSLFIGDYAQNWIKRVVLDANDNVVSVNDFIIGGVWPTDLATGPDGNIYYVDIAKGKVSRFTHTTGNRRPIPVANANPASGLAPLVVNFSSAGSSDPDNDALTYNWNFGDGTTSNLANPSHTYTANGTYNAVLTLTDSKGSSASVSVAVTVGNRTPAATIVSPASGSLYSINQTVQLNGQATDPEDGTLPASAFKWQVILHHNTHIHYLQEFTGTTNPTFTTPDHNDSDVYLEIVLTVTDSGGLTDSRSINMYLNNGASSGNLINNPSLETDDTLPGQPLGWSKGTYGVNDAVFTYPVTGIDGAKAAQIQINSYTSGDAKWYFSPVFVTPGQQYTVSNYYRANAITSHYAQYGFSNGTYQYVFLGNYPAAADATKITHTVTIPAGVQTFTLFHSLERPGTLTVDAYSLTLASNADTTAPTVVLTAPQPNANLSGQVPLSANASDNVGVAGVSFLIDGAVIGSEDTTAPYSMTWDTTKVSNGAHTVAARARDAAGNIATTTVVSVNINNATQNLITNGNFETANGVDPLGWTRVSWGSQTTAFTYPVTGQDGGKAVQVQITNYPATGGGDARWQFDDVQVTPGTEYTYEEWYKATTISDVIGRYTMSDGSYHYFGVTKELPAKTAWTFNTGKFIPPVGAKSVTLLHIISTAATLAIDDTKLYVSGSGTPSETEPPVVTWTNPLANATVAGVVNLSVNATDNVGVAGLFFAVDGTPISQELKSGPYTFVWDSKTVANGTHVLKATARDAVGNNSASSITVTVNNTPDTTPPTVQITAPAANASISGNATVTANATDNIAVAGVTLLVDNVVSGTEDVTAPYSFTLDTSTLSNGTHTIAARARDAAGNQTTSAAVTVTVNNSAPAQNLIANPSLETDGGNGNPANWSRGSWGTNATAFTYPVAGASGAKAVRVEMTSYTNGDAKWYFANVPVTPGTLYTLSHSYRSNIATNLTIRYTLANGTVQYAGIGDVPAAANWTNNSFAFTVPANVASMTLFHSILGVGWLELDDYVLSAGAGNPSDAFSKGMVTFSFDDGWISHYTNALSILNNGGVKGTFYIVTNETKGAGAVERIQNPSMETDAGNGNPANWSRGNWGTNTTTFTYPVTGLNNGKAARVQMTSYTNGDAKWYFGDVAVTPGEQLTFSNSYNATVPTQIVVRYTMTGGATQYAFLATVAATNGTWQSFQRALTVPANATSMTVFHVLAGVGTLTTDNYSITGASTSNSPYMNASQVLALQSAGHEVGAHTQTHPDLTTLTAAQQQTEIAGSRTDLLNFGVTTVNTLAYPYGAYNASVKTITQNSGFIGARSVERGFNLKTTDRYALKIQQVGRTTTMAEVQNWITQAAQSKTWLILMFHQIDEDPNATFGTTPANLQQMVNQAKAADVNVVTVREGLQAMNP